MSLESNEEVLSKVSDHITVDEKLEGMKRAAAKGYMKNKQPDYTLEVQFETKYHNPDWFEFNVYESPDGRYVTEFDDPTITKYHIGSKQDTRELITYVLGMIQNNSITSTDVDVRGLDLEIDV